VDEGKRPVVTPLKPFGMNASDLIVWLFSSLSRLFPYRNLLGNLLMTFSDTLVAWITVPV
jgi:hypothetical protein